MEGLGSSEPESEEAEADMVVESARAKEGLTSSTFTVPNRATILCDGEAHKVCICTAPDLATTFEYHVVPRSKAAAYMRGTSVNSTGYALLPGACSVFNEFSLLARSEIQYTAVGQKFSFFMGADSDIKVTYRQPSAVSDTTGVVVRTVRDVFEGEIVVRNSKAEAVHVVVKDQVPKSESTSIKVAVVEPPLSGAGCIARLDDKNLLVWETDVQGRETLTLPIKFTVEHPSGKELCYTWYQAGVAMF